MNPRKMRNHQIYYATMQTASKQLSGTLSVRGKLFEGKVVKSKGKDTVVLQKEAPVYFSKFKRYGRSTSRIHAHVPSNLQVNEGDTVIAAECRPIAKSVSFVVVEVKE